MSSIVHTIRLVTSATAAIAEVRKYEDQIVGCAQTVEKHANTLSGDRLLKSANEWTAAVAKLGGATDGLASKEQILAGVGKLTEAQQAKINKSVSEALEKYAALGETAPAAMIELADATKRVAAPTETMTSKVRTGWDTLKGFAGALGLGLGLSTIVAFGAGVVKTASDIGDLSSKLGTSVEFVQRMNYVAGQSGTTLDTVNTSVAKMNANLASGDKSTIDALRRAGLQFSEIRAMRPEEAFLAITDAIQKITDPMLQAELAVKLFGKSGQDLLPAIKDGIRSVGDETSVMSDETVKRLKSAGDAWEGLWNKIQIITGEAIASVPNWVDAIEAPVSSWKAFLGFASTGLTGNIGVAMQTANAVQTAVDSVTNSIGAAEKQQIAALHAHGLQAKEIAAIYRSEATPAIMDYVKSLDAARSLDGSNKTSSEDFVKELRAARAEIANLPASTMAAIDAALKLGHSVGDVAEQFHLSADAASIYQAVTAEKMEAVKKAHDEAARKVEEHKKKVDDLARSFGSQGLSAQAELLTEALATMGAVQQLTLEQQLKLNKAASAAISEYRALGKEAPAALQNVFNETLKLAVIPKPDAAVLKPVTGAVRLAKSDFDQLGIGIKAAGGALDAYTQIYASSIDKTIVAATRQHDLALRAIEPLRKELPAVYDAAADQIEAVYQSLVTSAQRSAKQQVGFVAQTLAGLPGVITSALQGGGGVRKSIFDFLGGSLFNVDSGPIGKSLLGPISTLGLKIGGSLGAKIAGGLANAVPAIGPIVGQILDKLVGSLFGHAGRDAVDKFADGFKGGYAGLHTQLLQLGDAGEALWVKLTQGVGRNNPEQAQAVINEITDALDRQQQHLDDLAAAVGRYAITWSDKTAAEQLKEIDQRTKQIISDNALLIESGVDAAATTRLQAQAVNDLLADVLSSGQQIPDALLPTLQTMAQLGLVSEANMRKMLGLSDSTEVDFKAMQTAAEKYGIDLSNLGGKFQQARLNDLFGEYASDFKLLIDGGADMNAVIEKMGPSIQTAVTDAQKFGATIPAAMKPAIQAMIDHKDLVDANGKVLTDISQLNFAEPIEKSMQDLVALFREFIDTLKKTRDAVNDIPKRVDVDIDFTAQPVSRHIADGVDAVAAARGGIVTDSTVQYLAAGGAVSDRGRVLQFRPRGIDTVPAMLAPGEGVVNRDGMGQLGPEGLSRINHGMPLAATGTDGASITVVFAPSITAWDAGSVDEWLRRDKRKIADQLVEELPAAARRRGIR